MIICPKCGKTYQSIPFYMHCFYCNFSFDTSAKAQAEAVASPTKSRSPEIITKNLVMLNHGKFYQRGLHQMSLEVTLRERL